MFHGRIDRGTAEGLKELRKRIAQAKIPSRKLDKNLNIATWNIREFGRKRRRQESIHFIAEILNNFDLTAITEVRRNLTDLGRVMEVLGPYWKVIFSDYLRDAGWNRERIAYLYDKRSVTFTGLAAEADAPRKKNRSTGEYLPQFSWWRSPYIASFKAGSFDFILITAHIRWGSGKKARIQPLELLADWIHRRRRDPGSVEKDIILMGDLNIPSARDELFKAITKRGLRIPKALRGVKGSNLSRNKRYDQILHYPSESNVFTENGGVVNFFYGGDDGIKKLYTKIPSLNRTNFTYQMSDHLPLWIEVRSDILDERLDQIIG